MSAVRCAPSGKPPLVQSGAMTLPVFTEVPALRVKGNAGKAE